MKKLLFGLLIILGGLEIASRLKVKPLEFYNVGLGQYTYAMEIYPVIMYRESKTVVEFNLDRQFTKVHEWHHVKQVQELGYIRYKASYLWYQLTGEYENNPYEIEAFEAEKESNK